MSLNTPVVRDMTYRSRLHLPPVLFYCVMFFMFGKRDGEMDQNVDLNTHIIELLRYTAALPQIAFSVGLTSAI